VAKHLLARSPARMAGSTTGLVEAGYAAAQNGAPSRPRCSCAGRSPSRRPWPPSNLALPSEGRGKRWARGWPRPPATCRRSRTDRGRGSQSNQVLASALNRSQRFAEAVEVLDRAASALDAQGRAARLAARGGGRRGLDDDLLASPTVAPVGMRYATERSASCNAHDAPAAAPDLDPDERARRRRRSSWRTGHCSPARAASRRRLLPGRHSLLWAERRRCSRCSTPRSRTPG
jgi:hypothetical protein